MKKIIALTLPLVMALDLCACGAQIQRPCRSRVYDYGLCHHRR